ncbi:MAG: GAF domain-containing protein [Bacteroidota bacterium]
MHISNIKYWKLNQKINAVLFFSSIFIILTMSFVGYYISQNYIKEQTFRHLTSIRESKKRNITQYFQQIKNQILTKAKGHTVINALKEFDAVFKKLQIHLTTQELPIKVEQSLSNYYENEYIPRLNQNLTKEANSLYFLPQTPITRYLQYHYISENSFPIGAKDSLAKASTDTSTYQIVHEKYHPAIQSFLKAFEYYDIFLVNTDGDIVYSVFKEIDFGTSLNFGPYATTNFGQAFKKAMSFESKDDVVLVDFEEYLPSYSVPASFIATPIFENDKKIGVLIFQMPIDKINETLTGNNNWITEGNGETGECYTIGQDLKLRSLPRLYFENQSLYLEKLVEAGMDRTILQRMASIGTSILLQPVNTDAAKATLRGESGTIVCENYLGEEVLSAYANIELIGLHWGIIAEVASGEAYAPVKNFRNILLFISAFFIIFILFFGRSVSRSIARPLLKIKEEITNVAKGELPSLQVARGKDEISAINNAVYGLVNIQEQIANFAENIEKGNFNVTFTPRSEDDKLGYALLSMKSALYNTATDIENRNWMNEGHHEASEILRSNEDIEAMYFSFTSWLAKYVDARVAGLYIHQLSNGEEILDLKAYYAYDKQKFIDQKIKPGYGIVGQTFLEGEITIIDKVPEDYLNIRSGLGDSNPRFLVIFPLKYNNIVHGILEMATFQSMPEQIIEFIEKIGTTLAATISNIEINKRTKQLLEKSEQRTTELREKEKMLQQYVTDLEATKETFLHKETEFKREIERLKQQHKTTKDAG